LATATAIIVPVVVVAAEVETFDVAPAEVGGAQRLAAVGQGHRAAAQAAAARDASLVLQRKAPTANAAALQALPLEALVPAT
jgi:hypothetical protein